jgi:BlaI family transcriptional regulator, penicillinase repressor
VPRKPSPTLTEAELRLMQVLWEKRAATVAQIAEALPAPQPHYSSIITILRVLEKKRFVHHRELGRAYVYEPLVDRETAADSAVGHVIASFFRNNPTSLALRLVAKEKLSANEVAQLRTLIDQYEDEPT